MIRSTMAPALPKKIAGLRYLSDRLWQAMAMTTALSPERMMLAMMIFHNAAQNTADERSGKTKTIKLPPTRAHHSCRFPVDATDGIREPAEGTVMASSAGYSKMFPV